VRGVEVTGCKDPPVAEIFLWGDLFHFLRVYEHLPRIRIGMLSDPFLGLDIINDGIGLHGIVLLDHFGEPNDIARGVPRRGSDHYIPGLVVADLVGRQVSAIVLGIGLTVQGYVPGRDDHDDGVGGLVFDRCFEGIFGDLVIRGIGVLAIADPDEGVAGRVAGKVRPGGVTGRQPVSCGVGPGPGCVGFWPCDVGFWRCYVGSGLWGVGGNC
jgi:hypothetical protein